MVKIMKISIEKMSSNSFNWEMVWPINTKEQNRAFRNTCLAIIKAFRQRDWNTLKKHSVRELLFSQYMRVYRDDYSKEQLRKRAFPDILFTEEDVRTWGEAAGSTRGFYTVVLASVNMSKPLRKWDEGVLIQLSKIIQDVSDAQILFSVNEKMLELPEFPSGPAIGGKRMSNVEWRLELRQQSGTWLVSQVIIAAH
jgi:hypothetical protein